jgi:hypothetical protein
MLRFLQKRKFRLVTAWKLALKENAGIQLPAQSSFPYSLIFHAFDEVLRALKQDAAGQDLDPTPIILRGLSDDAAVTADQCMELFLTGRDILGDFIEHDRAFAEFFEEADRRELHSACERVLRHLIEREMHEHSRRFARVLPHGRP